ncbi:MAG: AMP-binding protein [Chitinivibrionales bacterium]|nr:AMP-binding protein [Chitinivibrionales bacterium]
MNELIYADLLQESLKKNASRDCLHIKRNGAYQTWTYADFHHDLNRCTSRLKRAGVGPDAHGAVIGANCPEWVIAYHALFLTGGCTVPIDPNLPENEIEEIIRQTRVKVVFCSLPYINLFNRLLSKYDFLQQVIVLEPSCEQADIRFDTFISMGDAREDAFERTFQPDDPMVIIYTSGTTGKAKGVVLMQKNYTVCSRYGIPRMHVIPDDTVIAILPLHHVFGFAACLASELPTGNDIVFVPVIKGPLILEALNDKHVTILPAVPQMLERFYQNIENGVREKSVPVRAVFAALKGISATAGHIFGQNFRKKLFHSVHTKFGGNLKLVISGGSSLKKRYFDGFRLMGFNIVEGYGLTETFGPITLCPFDDPRQGSVGTIFPEHEIKLHNPDSAGIGEICFKGTVVFKGYYNNAAATQAVFDKDGWFHTGDLGRLSKDGFLFLTGRSKDVIVLDSGKNVYPGELEEYYAACESIEEIGVFGVEVGSAETVGAVIVPTKEIRKRYSIERARELLNKEISTLGQSLPTYKKIAAFAVSYEELPRTTTRKIKKPELKNRYEALSRQTGAKIASKKDISFLESSLMDSEEFTTIVSGLKDIIPGLDTTVVTPRSHMEMDIGLDSLKSLDLICYLEEKFNCSIADDALLNIETMGDTVRLLQDVRQRQGTTGSEPVSTRDRIRAVEGNDHLQLEESRDFLYKNGSAITGILSRLLWEFSVSGLENIPADHPIIIASNHESVPDIAWILQSLPWEIRRKTYSLGKKELLSSPLLSPLLKGMNMIPVEREGDIVEALKASIAVLKSNKNLVIFPEGTRTRTGVMGPFKAGIGSLVLETRATVVPARISGGFELWPAGKMPPFLFARKHKPHLKFGKPVTIDSLQEHSPDAIANALRQVIADM